jgi:hypothetical protein
VLPRWPVETRGLERPRRVENTDGCGGSRDRFTWSIYHVEGFGWSLALGLGAHGIHILIYSTRCFREANMRRANPKRSHAEERACHEPDRHGQRHKTKNRIGSPTSHATGCDPLGNKYTECGGPFGRGTLAMSRRKCKRAAPYFNGV